MNDEIEILVYGDDVTWGKYGKDIVPSPAYQVHRIKGAWASDDELLWYSFNPPEGKTSTKLTVKAGLDENKEYIMDEYNCFHIEWGASVSIKFSYSNLSKDYPLANLVFDGKYYDLFGHFVMNQSYPILMDRDHKFSIEWAEGLVETFHLKCGTPVYQINQE